jgi:hypothetical protein
VIAGKSGAATRPFACGCSHYRNLTRRPRRLFSGTDVQSNFLCNTTYAACRSMKYCFLRVVLLALQWVHGFKTDSHFPSAGSAIESLICKL